MVVLHQLQTFQLWLDLAGGCNQIVCEPNDFVSKQSTAMLSNRPGVRWSENSGLDELKFGGKRKIRR